MSSQRTGRWHQDRWHTSIRVRDDAGRPWLGRGERRRLVVRQRNRPWPGIPTTRPGTRSRSTGGDPHVCGQENHQGGPRSTSRAEPTTRHAAQRSGPSTARTRHVSIVGSVIRIPVSPSTRSGHFGSDLSRDGRHSTVPTGYRPDGTVAFGPTGGRAADVTSRHALCASVELIAGRRLPARHQRRAHGEST